MQCVILQPKGTTRNANLPSSLTELPTEADLAKLLRRSSAPEKVGSWSWKLQEIHLFAYKTGKPGTENKHELPPPYDEATLYGEAVLVATQKGALATFNTSTFTKFYNEITQEESDSESDPESEEDFESEVEEEAVSESESDTESESESESEPELEEEEEPEAPPVRVQTVKRSNKKTPHWFSLPELAPTDESKHAIRETCLKRIQTLLPTLSCEQTTDLEKGLFQCCWEDAKRRHVRIVWENPEFQTLYSIHVRRVLTNLDATSYVKNTRLMDRFKEGEFQMNAVPRMNYSDLYPENWVDLSEREMKREAKMLEVDTSMATDMFRCSRCGKRQCTYYEQQTRSADEPMTIFIRCVNCGKQWRQ